MKLHYEKEHKSCVNYKTNSYKGFGLERLNTGDIFDSASIPIRSNYLVFVQEGEFELQVDGKDSLQVHAGEFFFIPFFETYKIQTTKSGICIYYNFFHNDISLCDSTIINTYLSEGIRYEASFRIFEVNELLCWFLHGVNKYLQLGINCKHLHSLKEKELMIIIRTTYKKEDVLSIFHPILGSKMDFKESVFMLSDSIANRAELASLLGMSVSDLVRKFKEEFNESVHSWILKHRNKRILEHAALPGVTVKDLIYNFKFSSAPNFNRYCKQHFGCTPTELVKNTPPINADNKQFTTVSNE